MPGCPKRQQPRGRVHHQALVSPVASDLMSSPLRKRIRSPDLRDALSAGLPGGEKEDFTGGKWGGWQMRAKLRPAVPALDPAPLCSGPLWAEPGVGVLGARGPVSLSRWGKEAKEVSRTVLPSTRAPARPPLQTPCSAPPHTHTHTAPRHRPPCVFVTRRKCVCFGGRQSSASGWKTPCINHVF